MKGTHEKKKEKRKSLKTVRRIRVFRVHFPLLFFLFISALFLYLIHSHRIVSLTLFGTNSCPVQLCSRFPMMRW
jgi:hypothetical protein